MNVIGCSETGRLRRTRNTGRLGLAGGEPLQTAPERLAGHQQGAGGVRLKLHRENLLREEPWGEIKQNFQGTKSKDNNKKNVLWRHTLSKPMAF